MQLSMFRLGRCGGGHSRGAGAGLGGGSDVYATRHLVGKPDLQGVWDFRSLTLMQRPSDLAEQEVFHGRGSRDVCRERDSTRVP